jgi:hypothetical protein
VNSPGDWGVSGAAGVDEHFRPAPWVPLVRGLESRDAALTWLRRHVAGKRWARRTWKNDRPGHVHYLVHTGPADRRGEWEAWYVRPDTGEVKREGDGAALDASTR